MHPQVAYSNRFRLSIQNAKQWKKNSIPHRACITLIVNDVLHHCIQKPPFSSIYT